MGKIEVSILEYLGKFELGILVLVGINIDREYYDGTFYYDEENIVLTVSEEMEEKYGDIKRNPQYPEVLKSLLKKLVPYNEMYNRLDPIDFSKWVKGVIEVESPDVPQMVHESRVKPLPSSE